MPTVLTNTAPTLFIYILFFLFVSETFLGFFIGLQAVLFLDCLTFLICSSCFLIGGVFKFTTTYYLLGVFERVAADLLFTKLFLSFNNVNYFYYLVVYPLFAFGEESHFYDID